MREHCHLCGQEELLNLFSIKNIRTENYVDVVGSHCILRHFVLPEQLKKVMRFLETNSKNRQMLYGKYKGMKMIEVIKKDHQYILDELDNQTEYSKYSKYLEEKLKNSKLKKLKESFKCMEIVYNLNVRCQYVEIDNSQFEEYLCSDTYHNIHAKNYTRLPTAYKKAKRISIPEILKIIKFRD